MRCDVIAGYVFVRRTVLAALIFTAATKPGWGQAPGPKRFAYDVVSVKPDKAGSGNVRVRSLMGQYSATGISLKMLVQSAYNLKVEEQISGISGALSDERFDIEAKVDEETLAALKSMSDEERSEQRRLMLRAALEDRFKLKVHSEKKEFPIYALTVAKGGPKLKAAISGDTYANGMKGPDGIAHGDSIFSNNGTLTGQGIPMTRLADYLGALLHRMVEDRTGLKGKFDFTMQSTPEDRQAGAEDNGATNTAPSIFTALQEQLGLKLESTKGLMDTIVIDHAEMPSEN
jgi:uncharacterized protein (TIGR03435 family)